METIKRKRLLYKSKVEYMNAPGVYTMNHVQGCAHGCRYPCYAYLAARRFGQSKSMGEWMTPKPVENTIELLEREIKNSRKAMTSRKNPIRRVHMCFTTDPMPWSVGCSNRQTLERIHSITLGAIKTLNEADIPVTMLTKGALPSVSNGKCESDEFVTLWASSGVGTCIDIDDFHPDNFFGISLVTLSDEFRAAWEPGAAPIDRRIQSLRLAHDNGCKTWVSMEPFPTPQTMEETCGHIWNAASVLTEVAFVDRVVFGKWNYAEYDDPAWYREQARLLQHVCDLYGIELIVKKGTLK